MDEGALNTSVLTSWSGNTNKITHLNQGKKFVCLQHFLIHLKGEKNFSLSNHSYFIKSVLPLKIYITIRLSIK